MKKRHMLAYVFMLIVVLALSGCNTVTEEPNTYDPMIEENKAPMDLTREYDDVNYDEQIIDIYSSIEVFAENTNQNRWVEWLELHYGISNDKHVITEIMFQLTHTDDVTIKNILDAIASADELTKYRIIMDIATRAIELWDNERRFYLDWEGGTRRILDEVYLSIEAFEVLSKIVKITNEHIDPCRDNRLQTLVDLIIICNSEYSLKYMRTNLFFQRDIILFLEALDSIQYPQRSSVDFFVLLADHIARLRRLNPVAYAPYSVALIYASQAELSESLLILLDGLNESIRHFAEWGIGPVYWYPR